MIFRRILQTLFQFVVFGIGLEIDRTPCIFRVFQYPRYGFVIPTIESIGHSFSVTLCIVGFDCQNLVCCQHFCYLHGAFSGNTQIKNSLYHSGSFLVHNPLFLVVWGFNISVGRIGTKMFSGIAL